MAVDEQAELEVSGLTDDVNDDFLLLYFENKRRSGGGAIRSLTRTGPLALITFSHPEDVAGVLARAEHRLHHVTVQVRRPPPWDLRRLALCGLDPEVEEALLELYVEAVSGREKVLITRSADRTSALLSFQEELSDQDFLHLVTRVEGKRLLQRSLSVRRLRVSGEILVENIGAQISGELLEMYFESKRSGGGKVRSVTMRGKSAAIVSFSEWEVVDRVLSRQHVLQNCPLSVSSFHPNLLGSSGNDLTQEREMVEEEPTKTPDTENCQDLRSPAREEAENHEQMDGVEMYDTAGDSQNNSNSYEGSEVPPARPEAPQIRAEVSQGGPHAPMLDSTVTRSDELGTPRTQHSPGADQGHQLLDPARTSVSWGDEGGRGSTGDAPSSVQEAEVVMEAAELLFMQKYHHDLLAGMDAVTIFPLEEGDKFGFKVIGDSFSCKATVELLQHVVSSLSSRTITLDYPWVTHFLLESEGQRTLRDIETQHQCIIDTSQISWKLLDCVYSDPWSFVNDSAAASPVQSTVTDDRPDNPLLPEDIEGIKMFASLLSGEEEPRDAPSGEGPASVGGPVPGEDLDNLRPDSSSNENDPTSAPTNDAELDQAFQESHREYQAQQLVEEAQLLLAIQRSMDSRGVSMQEEDEELQKALEMSLLQQQSDDNEDSLQRALAMSLQDQAMFLQDQAMFLQDQAMSLQDQASHVHHQPIRTLHHPTPEANSHSAQIQVLAGDETGMVVASAALRKAITSKLNTLSLEGAENVQNLQQILEALEKKHKVKVTRCGRELQIQGFLHRPNQCRQEMSEILGALRARSRAGADLINQDMERDVEMADVPDTSEEFQRVVQPFMNGLQDLKQSIQVLQVQKVHNALLYNQYQLKKLRMVMTDPNIPAERILYHGTTESSAKEICHSGFNRSFSGRNATFFGEGVYFAVDSEVSTRAMYSPPNKEGKKFVFVARVLTGEYTLGKENMRTPPTMPSATGEVPRRYDSLVNNMKNPTIYVIFNDTQAYPEYLITCRRCKPTDK